MLGKAKKRSEEASKDLEQSFPPAFLAADQASLRGQRTYLRSTAGRLTLLAGAAVAGASSFTWSSQDIPGILSATFFSTALLLELFLLKVRPERAWYDGRAAAESIKTLSWKFAVGGQPFGISLDGQTAEKLLLERILEVLGQLKAVTVPTPEPGASQIPPELRAARLLHLGERRQLYLSERIRGQQNWYSDRARENEQKARLWSRGMLALEAVGALGSILRVADIIRFDVLGIAATLVAAGLAWQQAKQYQTLASAYAVTSHELSAVQVEGEWPTTEEEWSRFVDQAEEAISREHTTWKASRSTL